MKEPYISINTQSPDELASMVREIDPGLTFTRDLHPMGSSCRTLLVVDGEGIERILKVRHVSSNAWDDTYFYYEIHALRRVAERHLDNVTHLVREYRTDRYHAILKTYAEGTPCNTLDHEMLLRDSAFIRKLDALYMKLHLAGIAKIHYQPRKVVISPDEELVLVDLSTCIVNTECGIEQFSQEMREDSNFITRLERAAKKPARAA